MTKPCKDCAVDDSITNKNRSAPYPGPRCKTHHLREKKRRAECAHGRKIQIEYTLSAADYWAIYAIQGGKCALCQVATGKTRRLAVDHDHALAKTHDHPADKGCPLCIRGLLCKRCNTFGVPLNPAALVRGLNYLANPPARRYFAMKGIPVIEVRV